MSIRTFQQYVREQGHKKSTPLTESAVSKTLELVNDGVEIVINITLSRHEQHTEVIRFLRRVADELSALEYATADFNKNKHDDEPFL